jgi:sugar phosphate isomerase/epimerase
MRHGIAIWNYCNRGAELPSWIGEFAGYGFDTVSFLPSQIASASVEERRVILDRLASHDLAATVHGSCNMTAEEASAVVETLGSRLLAFTFDPAMREDSRGNLYDAARIASVLRMLQGVTDGTRIRLAVEDFPLDDLALEDYRFALKDYRVDLQGPLRHERVGILVDVGHMHLRMKRSDYFRHMSPAEYFARLPLKLVEIHVHDNGGAKDEHGHIGFGTVPFAEVAEALRAIKFAGVSTIEVAPSLHGSTPEKSKPFAGKSLKVWREMMEKNVAGLGGEG